MKIEFFNIQGIYKNGIFNNVIVLLIMLYALNNNVKNNVSINIGCINTICICRITIIPRRDSPLYLSLSQLLSNLIRGLTI